MDASLVLMKQDEENARRAFEAQAKKVLKLRRELMAEVSILESKEAELKRRAARTQMAERVSSIYVKSYQSMAAMAF